MFYRGDIVRCIDPPPQEVLTLNRLYAVILSSRNDPVVINDLGLEASYRGERFQLVEPVAHIEDANVRR